MSTPDNGAILLNAIAAWNEGDLPRYLELYDTDVILHGLSPGIRSVRAMYTRLWRAYPGSELGVDDLVVEGDKVACRYRWSATARTTGEVVTMPGITILHFRDGRCVERWDFEGAESNVS